LEEIIRVVRIPCKWGHTIKIKTLWDIHYGNEACDIKSLKAFVKDDEAFSWVVEIG
jgi:hypothetical protein